MKAAVISEKGKTPVFGDFPQPEVNEGTVAIAVKAAALSQLVRSRAAGTHYSSTGSYPFIPGVDGTGYLSNGDPVYFIALDPVWGSMAETALATPGSIVPLPANLDLVAAAAMGNPGMSSWAALTRRAALRTGETVLINGATGISGGLAVRIARHLGAGKIIVTGRNATALQQLRTEGADITLTLEQLPTRLPELMQEGVDVVLDYLWGESALDIMTAAVDGGAKVVRFVQIGSLSGQQISLHSKLLRSSGLTLMGSGLGSIAGKELVAAVAEFFQAAGERDFTVPFLSRPLSEVHQAWHEEKGRIVFTL
ncbi:quinone oxidoreductase family protein [Erwinia mallotivora]|uniref:quinone oxidoreductase family protein n=1 Tax=Erwinia mallotivora TaxID=69222 RepID=UPI0021C168BE|nr:zinc-binding alcohol dehydrogenase family protein [Erwinia mallotivora]